MRQIFEPSWTPKGTFDPTLEDEGWFDKGLTADAGAAGDATFTTLAGTATAAGGRPGPVIVGSASNNAGTGTSTGATVTLPAGIADGDVAYMAVSMNTGTDRGDPSGWELLDFTQNSAVVQQKVYRKSVGASDSSTAVSWTLSNAQKWNIAVVIVRRDGGVDIEGTAWSSGASATTWELDTVTPSTGDVLLLGFHAWRVATTGSTTSSAPTGWTEQVETSGAAAASPTLGEGILYREITGGSGSPTGTVSDGTYDGATGTHHVSFVLAAKALGPTGTATFDSTVGTGTADGGSTTFNAGATFDTLAGTATADGGSTTFTGGASFDTTVGDAPAAGGSSTFTGDATFSSTAGDAPADGGSSAFTGDAVFDTVVGAATADGGSTTFDVSGGGTDATFDTVVGSATADGGSSSFTGDAVFDTVEGVATASGGVTTFEGDVPAAPQGGGHAAAAHWFRPGWLDASPQLVAVDGNFAATTAATIVLSGGETTFDVEDPWPLTIEGHNALVLELV